MQVSEIRVDDEGIFARSSREIIIDALFDGRRIWSFWLQRDGEKRGRGHLVPWPPALTKFLDGRTELTLVEHGRDEILFQEEIQLGGGDQRISVVNARGKPLSLDKYFRRVQTFDTRSADHVAPLLDAIDDVLAALVKAGIDAFLVYGTLLGAVREGKLIGHDSDADLGYVSEHEHPADIMTESFRIQRLLAEAGYDITRYSGAAFKVDVREGDGSVRGLDVFGGFMRDGRLHLMGEIRTEFRREWIFPLATARLEGREFPVPADSDRFLAVTYGPSWRKPDPAFHFATPPSTYRRLNGWFRGMRVGRSVWDRAYSAGGYGRGSGPSELCLWMADREPDVAAFVDLGCGRGRDVSYMAQRGVTSLGLDVQPNAFTRQAARWPADGPASFQAFNVLELRHVAVAAAQVALMPQPRVVLARHLADTLSAPGRAELWRTARMMLSRPSDRFYLEFLTVGGDDGLAAREHVRTLSPKLVRRELEAAGATIVHQESNAVSPDPTSSQTCRIVAQWNR